MHTRSRLAAVLCAATLAGTSAGTTASAEQNWRRDALRHLGSSAERAARPGGDAATGTVSAADPQSLVDAMQAEGYVAKLSTDSSGEPHVSSSAAGVNFDLDFYTCTDGGDCETVCFTAGFDLSNGSTPEVMNRWNADSFIGPAYLDEENDPYLDYCLVALQGMPAPAFASVLRSWSAALGDFQRHIGF
ncbi:YbjN domain-containing protein [Paroceanicella profunda]|uniref:YbjN domain-containing protein n=1 Tax=Paroceanicella profunda TaxID=2579971 RepID=A0A5B8FZN9_9RHOB|nr:YbjN domain-containing protein [Paroceanicella profunda]QDL92860.1 YbjN domain-containing protein [Paroceanicella profunda]